MQIDVSELVAHADNLVDRSVRNSHRVVATTIKAGVNIRDEVRENLKGSTHYPALGLAMTYDVNYSLGHGVEVEVGYDKSVSVPTKKPGPGTVGNLGSIREFGSATVAPHGDLERAFQREVPVWQRHVEVAAGDL